MNCELHTLAKDTVSPFQSDPIEIDAPFSAICLSHFSKSARDILLRTVRLFPNSSVEGCVFLRTLREFGGDE